MGAEPSGLAAISKSPNIAILQLGGVLAVLWTSAMVVIAPENEANGQCAFSIIQLHTRHERGWAVIDTQSGAIAEDRSGRLIMRLSRQEAAERAARMCALGVHIPGRRLFPPRERR